MKTLCFISICAAAAAVFGIGRPLAIGLVVITVIGMVVLALRRAAVKACTRVPRY